MTGGGPAGGTTTRRAPQRAWAVWLVLIWFCPVSSALDLPGSGDPEFRVLVDAWLDDDDAKSLPGLSALALQGNVAARLLLSRIETTDSGPSEFVKRLSRAERAALFRPAGSGPFRPSWLAFESERGNDVASALLQATSLGINIEAVQRLQEMGEHEATGHLVRKIAVDGSQAQREQLAAMLPPDSEWSPYLRAFLRMEAQDGGDGLPAVENSSGWTALQTILGTVSDVEPTTVALNSDAESLAAMAFVDTGFQAGGQSLGFGPGNRYFLDVAHWVTQSTQGFPVANFCGRVCSAEEVSACANTSLGIIGGYYEIVRFDSPLQSIISQQRFLSSERAIGAVSRRMAFATTEAGDAMISDPRIRQLSGCLADALAEEAGAGER